VRTYVIADAPSGHSDGHRQHASVATQ